MFGNRRWSLKALTKKYGAAEERSVAQTGLQTAMVFLDSIEHFGFHGSDSAVDGEGIAVGPLHTTRNGEHLRGRVGSPDGTPESVVFLDGRDHGY